MIAARAEIDAEELREGLAAAWARAANGMPKKVGRGMPLMPFGPLVRTAQLIRTMRMISPKPSVTMAR